jgi:hypothetical protein
MAITDTAKPVLTTPLLKGVTPMSHIIGRHNRNNCPNPW